MKQFKVIYFLLMLPLMWGCNDNDPDCGDCTKGEQTVSKPGHAKYAKRAVLVYAVNNNNLSYELSTNEKQMKAAMSQIDFANSTVLLYKTDDKESAGIYEMLKGEMDYEFKKVKNYDRSRLSTDPIRVAEVMRDMKEMCPDAVKTLVMWGHGKGWAPMFTNHNPDEINPGPYDVMTYQAPMLYAFGGEGGNKLRDFIEIDDLEKSIPDNTFDAIWFDACYMSSIEVLYQFRNKCRVIVAYPTEVYGTGASYSDILPHILTESPDYEQAAFGMFNYYDQISSPVTVAVTYTAGLENLAKATKAILDGGEVSPYAPALQNYSRDEVAFYDFSQYIREYAVLNGSEAKLNDFIDALQTVTPYALASKYDFRHLPINQENYCGISTHYYKGIDSAEENYYRSLEWYKATR